MGCISLRSFALFSAPHCTILWFMFGCMSYYISSHGTIKFIHLNNIQDLHARTSSDKFLSFSPSVLILTSSPLLSCHSGSTTIAEIWRHIDFLRWRPRSLNTTSGFVFLDVLAFRRSESIICQQTTFRRHQRSTYINLWLRYNDFWFGKTNLHHIGILLPVPISTIFRNLHFILHQRAEFRPNLNTHCENRTSYPFIKMAATTAK